MDYGMPILRGTACSVGTHVWITSGNSTKQTPIPSGQRCECGAHVFNKYAEAWKDQNTETERAE